MIPGSLNELSGDAELTQCYAQSHLSPGDVIYLHCQGGGGYGDPLLREPQAVAADVADHLVSLGAAGNIYGVCLRDDGSLDADGTAQRRQQIIAQRRQWSTAPKLALTAKSPEQGRLIDDNLMISADEAAGLLFCSHCGTQVGDTSNYLHLAALARDSREAGPGVRADPGFFIAEPIHLRQWFCPGCFAAIHTAIAPHDDTKTISGFALA
jgi:N-methylhydantoinase B